VDDAEPPNEPGPFATHLGFRLIRADAEGALVEAEPQPEHLNGAGIVHGGYLASMLDTTTGWAVHRSLPLGVAAPHVHLTVQYVRAALPAATLTCEAHCQTAGRRIASAEATITQNGRLIARAVSSHAVLSDVSPA
jgi:acyl-CoA thioesterase